MPTIVRKLHDLRAIVRDWRNAGQTVALVPTMGALHSGHLSLVTAARSRADRAIVSIFVNPTQFAPNEDLARYPRDEAGDVAKLATVNTDLVWAPTAADMYPEGFATRIDVQGAALPLEGAFRPHHFSGVATVVCKLLMSATPDIALFGEKDFQQLAVIRQLVADLNLPVEIAGVATARDPDGLALSSRNAYLTAEERAVAPLLYRALCDVAHGGDPDIAKQSLLRAGFATIDYLEVRDAATLALVPPGTHAGQPKRVLAAAWLGKTRLIDNVSA